MRQTELQHAYRQILTRYEAHFEFAATLTLKRYTVIRNEHQLTLGQGFALNEDILKSTIRYFTANLTRYLYGNAAKHKNKQHTAKPLLFFVLEGSNNAKREHLHIILGNVPEHKKANIEALIKAAWAQCDFGYRQVDVKSIYDGAGWAGYITKEIGYENNEALCIVDCVIPDIYSH
jgi:hypothetical protein